MTQAGAASMKVGIYLAFITVIAIVFVEASVMLIVACALGAIFFWVLAATEHLGDLHKRSRQPEMVSYTISVMVGHADFNREVLLPFLPAKGQILILFVGDTDIEFEVKTIRWFEPNGEFFIEMVDPLDGDPILKKLQIDPNWLGG